MNQKHVLYSTLIYNLRIILCTDLPHPLVFFSLKGQDIFLLKGDSNQYELPWQHDLSNHDVPLHAFGTYHDIACMTGCSKAPLSHPLGTWVNLKKAFSYLEPQWAQIAIKAHQIANFTQYHQFLWAM